MEPKKKNEQDAKLNFDLILAYSPADTNKALDTLKLNKLTAKMMEEHCANKNEALSYSQIRNVLQEVKNSKNLSASLPKLAYMEARQEKSKQKDLLKFIRELLEKSIEENKTQTFIQYMDTLVAYHKYYSTK